MLILIAFIIISQPQFEYMTITTSSVHISKGTRAARRLALNNALLQAINRAIETNFPESFTGGIMSIPPHTFIKRYSILSENISGRILQITIRSTVDLRILLEHLSKLAGVPLFYVDIESKSKSDVFAKLLKEGLTKELINIGFKESKSAKTTDLTVRASERHKFFKVTEKSFSSAVSVEVSAHLTGRMMLPITATFWVIEIGFDKNVMLKKASERVIEKFNAKFIPHLIKFRSVKPFKVKLAWEKLSDISDFIKKFSANPPLSSMRPLWVDSDWATFSVRALSADILMKTLIKNGYIITSVKNDLIAVRRGR